MKSLETASSHQSLQRCLGLLYPLILQGLWSGFRRQWPRCSQRLLPLRHNSLKNLLQLRQPYLTHTPPRRSPPSEKTDLIPSPCNIHGLRRRCLLTTLNPQQPYSTTLLNNTSSPSITKCLRKSTATAMGRNRIFTFIHALHHIRGQQGRLCHKFPNEQSTLSPSSQMYTNSSRASMGSSIR